MSLLPTPMPPPLFDVIFIFSSLADEFVVAAAAAAAAIDSGSLDAAAVAADPIAKPIFFANSGDRGWLLLVVAVVDLDAFDAVELTELDLVTLTSAVVVCCCCSCCGCCCCCCWCVVICGGLAAVVLSEFFMVPLLLFDILVCMEDGICCWRWCCC